MIYIYGLVAAPPETVTQQVEGMMGLQAPVAVTAIGTWSLVHSDHDAEPILPRRRLMLAHTRVLERLLPLPALLPARFGLVTDTALSAQELILPQEARLAAACEKVAGAAEFGVRVEFDRTQALGETLARLPDLRRTRDRLARRGPDAHYEMVAFGERLGAALDQRRLAAQKALLAPLRAASRDHVLRAPESDVQVLKAEFLVASNQQADFAKLVADSAAQLDFAADATAEIQIIGPAPAYHFVHLNLSSPQEEEAA